ncbi:MAG: urea amidolyase family protein [Actinomycetota bacterium]|nr:urea amidolyase family protein [Actinomycetota bacterium]
MDDRVGSWAVRPVGRSAVLVDAADRSSAALAAGFGLAASRRGVACSDIVAGANTVLLIGADPSALTGMVEVLSELAAETIDDPTRDDEGPEMEIPVRYDGADLDQVARMVELTTGEVVALHSGATYRAAFMGFAPGFAYLVGLSETLMVRRRLQPRSAVPAGSVAIADTYSAVYPRSTPGGWHLLGTTDVVVFDADRRPPALLATGACVRFVEVRNHPSSPRRRLPGPVDREAWRDRGSVGGVTVEVVDPGPLTTLQDQGRAGHAGAGVPPSGAADGASAALANRLVGNDTEAAVLETTMGGLTLRLATAPGTWRTVAVTGAVAPVTVDGVGRSVNAPFDLHTGQMVRVGPAVAGLRSYIAVSGGLEVPAVLGSRSTDLLSGIGPPVLKAGDVVALGADEGRRPGVDVAPVATRGGPPVLVHVRLGPRADWLTDGGLRLLESATWTVAPTSNRVGVRLRGPALERSRRGELAPEGLVTGAIELTPADELVVCGPDHPVTGGYPVVGVVDEAELGAVAQLRPGDMVRLRADRS